MSALSLKSLHPMSKAPSPKMDQIKALRERKFAGVNKSQKLINRTAHEKIAEGLQEAIDIAQGKREPALLVTPKRVRDKEYMRQAQAKWRSENIETNRLRAREGMRKKRSKPQ